MSDRNRNELWGRVLMEELARCGVEQVVVAPGSRSTPLVMAAHAHPDLTVRVCLDERSAAFFALGVGRASGIPAVVVTTSGTAVANLLPAAVEADRAEVPLLLVTADRPRELRDADANQSVRQPGMFATCARAEWDLMHPEISDDAIRHLRGVACRAFGAARGPGAGPVHVNVPLRKPLEPTPVEADRRAIEAMDARVREGRPRHGGRRPPWTVVDRDARGTPEGLGDSVAGELGRARRPLVVFGHPGTGGVPDGGPSRLLEPLADLGLPILVDPLSGLRACGGSGTTRVAAYDTLLRDETMAARLRPDLILQVGRTPTSRVLSEWMAGCGARRVVLDDGPLHKDHSATAEAILAVGPAAWARAVDALDPEERARIRDGVEPGWLDAWATAEAAARGVLDARAGLASDELRVAGTVLDHTPEGLPVFVSSSMPIRDVDTVWGCSEREVPAYGNRGASGIDGIVSSALGVAVGSARRDPSEGERPRGVCLLGDLAFLHDANGLSMARAADVVFVVVNNDGGGIFGMLPVAEFDPPFTELFATPHGRDLSAHSAAFGVPHEVVEVGALGAALETAIETGGTRVIEVRTDRRREVEARATDRRRAIAAAREALEP